MKKKVIVKLKSNIKNKNKKVLNTKKPKYKGKNIV